MHKQIIISEFSIAFGKILILPSLVTFLDFPESHCHLFPRISTFFHLEILIQACEIRFRQISNVNTSMDQQSLNEYFTLDYFEEESGFQV